MTAMQVVVRKMVVSQRLHPAAGGLELLCSTSGPLRAGCEAPFQAFPSVSFTAAWNISKGLIYCNSSGKQLL